MATYSTKLKTWGSTGSEYPDNYNYLEGEQPVDAWDNFIMDGLIDDIKHLINLTNARFADENGNEATSGGVRLQNAEWVMARDSGNGSDLGLWMANSSDQAESNLPVKIGGDLLATNGEVLWDESESYIPDSQLQYDYVTESGYGADRFQKEEGGTVPAGDHVMIGKFGVDDGETLEVVRAILTASGFNAAPSGLNLVIVTTEDNTVVDTTILSGDGTTLYDDETGSPLASYSNSSGSHQTVAIAINNGDLGQSGVGSEQVGYGGYTAKIV